MSRVTTQGMLVLMVEENNYSKKCINLYIAF